MLIFLASKRILEMPMHEILGDFAYLLIDCNRLL